MKEKTDKREALLDSSVVKGKWCVFVAFEVSTGRR